MYVQARCHIVYFRLYISDFMVPLAPDIDVDNFVAVRTNKITRGHPYTLVNHSVKFVPVVTSMHVEYLILGTT